MAFSLSYLTASASLLSLSWAFPTLSPILSERQTFSPVMPLPPSQDPWYAAPVGFEAAPPGAVLSIRVAPGNVTSAVTNSSAAYNILYRTTDSLYRPTWAVTTLFVPLAGPFSGKALLSFAEPYDSASVDAGPSYAFYSSIPSDNIAITNALNEGWYVSVPDYEGPLASYTAGVLSGHAVLDSVRAVRSTSLGLALDAPVAMWGYSGGALASEWAAELQVQYAPELDFRGAALGGTTPTITSVLESVNGTLAAGLAASGILGLTNQFPDIQILVTLKLKTTGASNATGFLAVRNMTQPQAAQAFAMQDIFSYFTDGISDVLIPEVQKLVYSDGIMGYHGIPQMPLYIYKAIQDEISPVADTDNLVTEYCNMGVNITYVRNTVGGHAADAVNGFDGAFSWLTSVLNTAAPQLPLGCTTQNVTVDIAP